MHLPVGDMKFVCRDGRNIGDWDEYKKNQAEDGIDTHEAYFTFAFI